MATRKEIELEIKLDKAQKSLDAVKEELFDINDNLTDVGKKGTKAFKNVENQIESSTKTTSGLLKGLTSIGSLFKASGVFFVAQKIFDGLSEAFMNNQVFIDGFAVAGKMATKVIGDFTNFVFNNFGTVSDFFKSVFEDPKGMIDNLVQGIKDNLLERLNSAIEMFGLLGSAIKKLFARDFEGAMADAKEAGKEFVDVMTGVDGTTDKVAEAVTKTAKAVVDYTTNTYKAAKATVELNKEAELLEAVNQGLIESYDVQAERQRQLRDDESLSIEDRIKANNKLGEILDKQAEDMLANATKVRDARLAEFNLDKTNQEAKLALIQAENELDAVQARVTGFRSEQLVNQNSLLKEQKEIMQELNMIGADEFETAKVESEAKLAQQIDIINREVQNEDLRNELIRRARQAHADRMLIIEQNERDERFNEAKRLFSELEQASQLFGKKGRAFAIASIVTEQVQAISKIVSNISAANAKAVAASPLTGGMPFVALNTIRGGIEIAASLSQAKKSISAIRAQNKNPQQANIKAGGGGGSVSNVAQPNVDSQVPAFNVVGASPVNQLAESMNNQQKQPIKAFVVSNDVTSAQALDRNIIETASIG